MSATSRDTGREGRAAKAPRGEVVTSPAPPAATVTGSRGTGRAAADSGTTARPAHLGWALAVIATAQLMVVLDATIVNVALPHIQHALGFSGTNLEWVINAYALAFGGLLLLGGRSGDLLGRRRVFIFGILVFSAASLFGGFANSQAWLLTARVIQGAGGAFAATTALSLVAVTFPEGRQRNRAMGVYAAMSVAGGAVGLLAGGILTTYASWRWVLFVNVPIGLVVALAAPRVLGESARQRGRFDLPGALTGTLGLAALVYGLSNAATSQNGVSHWGDTRVVVSLVASAVLLVAFGIIEWRSQHALLPMRVLRSRDRSGSYLLMLCVGTAMFGMFFFLTIFVQTVWGYSPLKSGVSYLPMVAMIMVASGAGSQLVPRIGARPLLIAGSVIGAGGMFWLSRINEHSTYVSGLLGPMLVTAFGLGLLFVPISLISLSKVADSDTGAASSLLNAGQQIGGSIGLAVLGTVAWSAVANSVRTQQAAAAKTVAAAAAAGHPLSHAKMAALQTSVYDHALSVGFSHGYLVSAGIAFLGLIITLLTIRVRREDLAGVNPMSAGM
ncbi:MAG TPA: MFS transporter [Streptosporangiaceae bacterium]|nr:MFS transporter [Streptosporangiaceae bacterium]